MSAHKMTISPSRISGLLSDMADAIETYGHFQSGRFDGGCCLVFNPAMAAAGIGARRAVIRLLAVRLGFEITTWNDSTPTGEVLRFLRDLADELRTEAA